MSELRAKLQGRFGDFQLDCSLHLPGTGVTALFGASGSGKSLSLRCLAGVERLPGAEVQCGDQIWQRDGWFLPAQRRRIGWLPQSSCLFEHRDVQGNLRYALDRRHEAGPTLAEVAAQTGIAHLLARRCSELSGGERQRVALARALLSAPRWLLLDEPLSALDQAARRGMSQLLRRLNRELSLPMLLVSHAADEVEHLADHVVAITAGRSSPRRSLADTLADPASALHLDAGPAAVFDLPLLDTAAPTGLLALDFDAQPLWIPWSGTLPTNPIRVRIAARDVTLWSLRPPPSSAQNLQPLILQQLDQGAGATVLVTGTSAAGRVIYAQITSAAQSQLQLEPGQTVWAQFKAVALGAG